MEWDSFSKEEFKTTISKCNDSYISRLDKILWKILKQVINNDLYLIFIINIVNACINLGYWPSYFKMLILIIITKPNKILYDSSKSFCSIVLLNTLGKLIEKIIGERMQFHFISNNFIYPNQLGGLKQYSTLNTDIFLTHLI